MKFVISKHGKHAVKFVEPHPCAPFGHGPTEEFVTKNHILLRNDLEDIIYLEEGFVDPKVSIIVK